MERALKLALEGADRQLESGLCLYDKYELQFHDQTLTPWRKEEFRRYLLALKDQIDAWQLYRFEVQTKLDLLKKLRQDFDAEHRRQQELESAAKQAELDARSKQEQLKIEVEHVPEPEFQHGVAEMQVSDQIVMDVRALFGAGLPYNNGYEIFLDGLVELFEDDSDRDLSISYAHKVFDERPRQKMVDEIQVYSLPLSFDSILLTSTNSGLLIWPTGIGIVLDILVIIDKYILVPRGAYLYGLYENLHQELLAVYSGETTRSLFDFNVMISKMHTLCPEILKHLILVGVLSVTFYDEGNVELWYLSRKFMFSRHDIVEYLLLVAVHILIARIGSQDIYPSIWKVDQPKGKSLNIHETANESLLIFVESLFGSRVFIDMQRETLMSYNEIILELCSHLLAMQLKEMIDWRTGIGIFLIPHILCWYGRRYGSNCPLRYFISTMILMMSLSHHGFHCKGMKLACVMLDVAISCLLNWEDSTFIWHTTVAILKLDDVMLQTNEFKIIEVDMYMQNDDVQFLLITAGSWSCFRNHGSRVIQGYDHINKLELYEKNGSALACGWRWILVDSIFDAHKLLMEIPCHTLLCRSESGTQHLDLNFLAINYLTDVYLHGLKKLLPKRMFQTWILDVLDIFNPDGKHVSIVLVFVRPPDHSRTIIAEKGQDSVYDIAKEVDAHFVERWDWTSPIWDQCIDIWHKLSNYISGSAILIDFHVVLSSFDTRKRVYFHATTELELHISLRKLFLGSICEYIVYQPVALYASLPGYLHVNDESLVDVENSEFLPNRGQVLNPYFHSSRFYGSGNVHVDDDYIGNAWNLRIFNASTLDVNSIVCGDGVLPTSMPIVQVELSSNGAQVWTPSRFSESIMEGISHQKGYEKFGKILIGVLYGLLDTDNLVQAGVYSTSLIVICHQFSPSATVQYHSELIMWVWDFSDLAKSVGSVILVLQSYLRDFLLPYYRDDDSDARKHALVLLDNLPRACLIHLVAVNACWSIGELVIQVDRDNYLHVMTVMSGLFPNLHHTEELNISLTEISAFTLWRLAWVYSKLVHFMQLWCSAVTMIREDADYEDNASWHELRSAETTLLKSFDRRQWKPGLKPPSPYHVNEPCTIEEVMNILLHGLLETHDGPCILTLGDFNDSSDSF